MKVLVGMVIVAVVTVAVLVSAEGAATLVFGWARFLGRVIPNVRPDGPTVAVSLIAVLLFGIGIHQIGRKWRVRTGRWTVRSTAAVVLGVIVLFAAGIALVGVVHQASWLATDEGPIQGESLAHRRNPDLAMHELLLGFHNYETTEGTFPSGGTFTPSGEMLHSWETQLLPYLWYDNREIDQTRPWNDPRNQTYFRCIVPEFVNPGFRTPPLFDGDGYGLSHYAANSRVMGANTHVRMTDLTNGASETILIGEVNSGFRQWGHPVNWRDPAAGVGGSPRGFGGPPGAGGARFLMADGSVRFVGDRTSPDILESMAGPRQAGR